MKKICTSSSWFFVSAFSARFSSVLFSGSSQWAKHPQASAFGIAMTNLVHLSSLSPNFLPPPFNLPCFGCWKFPLQALLFNQRLLQLRLQLRQLWLQVLELFHHLLRPSMSISYRDVNTQIVALFLPHRKSSIKAAWCWMILHGKNLGLRCVWDYWLQYI